MLALQLRYRANKSFAGKLQSWTTTQKSHCLFDKDLLGWLTRFANTGFVRPRRIFEVFESNKFPRSERERRQRLGIFQLSPKANFCITLLSRKTHLKGPMSSVLQTERIARSVQR